MSNTHTHTHLLTYAYVRYINRQMSERAQIAQITPAPGAQCPSCGFEAVGGCVPDAAALQFQREFVVQTESHCTL